MKIERKPLAVVTTQAFKVLFKELGSADTIWFINQYTNGQGNYTSERDALFAEVMLDQIALEIKREPKANPDQGPPI